MTSLDSINQSDRPHVADQIEAYLAGGLTAGERAAFEAHVAGCPGCRALLEQIREADSALADLFAAARPGDGFEDRLIAGLRKAPSPRWYTRLKTNPVSRMILHPSVRRAAFGVAAAVVLAAVGHAAKSALDHQSLPGMRHGKQFADLRTDLIHWRDRGRDSIDKTNPRQGGAAAPLHPNGPSGSSVRGWHFNNTLGNDVLQSSNNVTKSGDNGATSSTALYWGKIDGRAAAAYKSVEDSAVVALSDDSSSTRSRNTWSDWSVRAPANTEYTLLSTAGGLERKKDFSDTYVLAQPPAATSHQTVTAGTPAPASTPAQPNVVLGGDNPPVTNGPVAVPASGSGTSAASGADTFRTGVPAGGALSLGGQAGDGISVITAGGTVATPENLYAYGMNAKAAPHLGVVQDSSGSVASGAPSGGPGAPADFGRLSPGGGNGGGGYGGGGGRSGAAGLVTGRGEPAAAGFEKGFKPTDLAFQSNASNGEVTADRLKVAYGMESAPVDHKGKEGVDAIAAGEGKVAEHAEAGKAVTLARGLADGELKDRFAGPADKPQSSTPAVATETGLPVLVKALAEPAAAPASDAPAKETADQAPAPTPAPPPVEARPAQAAPAQTAPPVAPTPAELQALAMQRKIIRNGEMLFDVDSFDSAMMQVGKIAAEEGGFIATTDSEKLPNGKVKGSVIVRCPPDRLDTLVLKLRGLGDLKSQRIAAQDITKQYTDLESQLRAAHAMEDRLLAIIKDGKGAIKDLLEAEKQLGVWREKLEGLQGEINYYNNLVSLSTLTIALMERDIKTPYATAQSEHVSMGVVAEDVEKARADAISQIEAAKGRILESDLKKHEAAQFSATIVAVVAPDAADPLIDRLKQIGRVARLERERKQTSEGGTGTPPPGVKIERQDTRLQLSIYNLADVSPRTSTTMNLAAADVEKSYKSIVDQVKAGGGRIVSSQLNRPKADQVTGTITFDVPSEKADVLSAAIRSGVEVMRLDVTENKDSQDVTDAKRGFVLQIFSLASVAPRETTTMQIASKDVPVAFNKLLDAARTAGGRVSTSQLNEQNVASITGTLDFDVPRDNSAKVDAALREAGVTVTRNVSRSPDSDSTVDSKVRLQVTLIDEINLAARQTIAQSVAARNVPEAFNKLADALHDAGARIVTSQLNDQDKPTVNAQINFSIEREDAAKVEAAVHEAGETVVRSVARSADLQNTVDTKVSYQVTIVDQRNLQPRETVSELVAVRGVPERYAKVLETLRLLDAQVYSSQLIEQNKNDVSAVLDFAVRRDSTAAREQGNVEKALGEASDIFSRTVVRSQDVTNTVDTKVRYQVTMRDADTQPPRETYTLEAEAADVDKALADLEAAGIAAGGRAVDSTPATTRNEKGEPIGRIVLDVPLARAGDIVNAVRDKGHVTATRRSRDDRVPEGALSRARIEVTFGTGAIMAGEGGLWETIRSGLRTSAAGLLYALQFLIIGLCLIGPFLLGLWVLIRAIRWARRKPAKSAPSTPAQPSGPSGPVPAAG